VQGELRPEGDFFIAELKDSYGTAVASVRLRHEAGKLISRRKLSGNEWSSPNEATKSNPKKVATPGPETPSTPPKLSEPSAECMRPGCPSPATMQYCSLDCQKESDEEKQRSFSNWLEQIELGEYAAVMDEVCTVASFQQFLTNSDAGSAHHEVQQRWGIPLVHSMKMVRHAQKFQDQEQRRDPKFGSLVFAQMCNKHSEIVGEQSLLRHWNELLPTHITHV